VSTRTGKETLYLDQVPQGVAYNGPWLWQLSSTARTTIAAGTFPLFASETGLDSYRFHLTVIAPEPGSLAALTAGLGLAGFALRRRRRP
jgi:hypothetical protein